MKLIYIHYVMPKGKTKAGIIFVFYSQASFLQIYLTIIPKVADSKNALEAVKWAIMRFEKG